MKPKCVGRFVLFHHQMYSLNLYSALMPSFFFLRKNLSEGAHYYWVNGHFRGLIASNCNYSENLKQAGKHHIPFKSGKCQ